MPLTVDGRQKVKTLKEAFKNEFGVSIRVYYGKKFADDDATLASIRAEGAPSKADFEVHGNTKVGKVEKQFKEALGISVQIENAAGGLADNEVSLSSLKKGQAAKEAKGPASKAVPQPAPARKKSGGFFSWLFGKLFG
jgi:hypothetical protein